MIRQIKISGIRYELTERVEKYVRAKVGRLDRYMPRSARRAVWAETKLTQSVSNKKGKFSCEVILHLPNGNVTAEESTLNMFAAIDIVEAKLKNRLRKYKDKHLDHHKRSRRREIFTRLRRLADKDHWGSQN